MRIRIRYHGVDASNELKAHVIHRIRFRLTRFGSEIDSVAVSFADVNGPKGGLDTRCRLRVRGARLGTVALESLSEDPYFAIADILDRTQRALRRQLQRRRDDDLPFRRRAG